MGFYFVQLFYILKYKRLLVFKQRITTAYRKRVHALEDRLKDRHFASNAILIHVLAPRIPLLHLRPLTEIDAMYERERKKENPQDTKKQKL